ncbi:MAG: hypothetical protein C4525_04555 [Desulfarculus sp.]|jgi:hypothetical protein|nr:MAG: hypothetical protein C4525_04555 [Desulfarculus sp.]
MKKSRPLTAPQRENLLRDLWFLQDGRWFLKVSQELGFAEATRLNLLVVESFGRTEIKLLMQEAGIDSIADAEGLAAYLRLAGEVFFPPEHRQEFRVLDGGIVLGRASNCFLYRHLRQAGTTQIHQCGAQTRFTAWLEGLGLKGWVDTSGRSATCEGACEILFHVTWPEEGT